MEKKISFGKKAMYGVGNLGYSVISQTVTNFFMFFATGVLGMSGALAGVAVGISTLWDGITDPVVGYISDNYAFRRFGNRRGYMFFATFGMALINILLWHIPVSLGEGLKFLCILLSLLLLETFNTLYATPYGALANDLTENYHEETKIQISKTIFFLVGMMIPSVLLYIFLPATEEYELGQLNPVGYRNISYVTSVLCILCGMLCVFFTQKMEKKEPGQKLIYRIDQGKRRKLSGMFKEMFKSMKRCFKNKQQKYIIVGYSIALISAAVLTSVGMHFFTYCFKYSSIKITITLVCLLIGTIISQPLWFHLSKKKDKKPALLIAIAVAMLGIFSIMLVFIFKDLLKGFSFYIILLSIFVCGIGSGALYTLPNSMFCDVVNIQNKSTNDNKTASYYGYMTLAFNIANAMALLVVGILLDLIKFDPTKQVQPVGVQTGIAIILFVGVILPLLIAYYIFSKYSITKKDVMQKRKKKHDEKHTRTKQFHRRNNSGGHQEKGIE